MKKLKRITGYTCGIVWFIPALMATLISMEEYSIYLALTSVLLVVLTFVCLYGEK